MALNRVYEEGRRLYAPVSAGTVSGSPVAVGSRCGVALTTRDAALSATVDHKGVFDLTVIGATVPGTPIYYTENANPLLRLGIVATALFFGYALETQAGPGAGIINVVIGEASGISTLAAGSLEGSVVANVANANVIGGIPVIHRVVCANAAADTDVTLTHKTRVLDVWAVKTTATGVGSAKTLTVKSTAAAITDDISLAVVDKTVVRVGTIDDANHEIAAGGILRCTIATTGQDASCIVYVLGIRVA